MTDEEIKAFLAKALKEYVYEPVHNRITGFIHFNNRELWKMPRAFKKQFKEDGAVAHIAKSLEKGVIYYEIKYRNIVVKNKNLKKTKKLFINKTKECSTEVA